MRQRGRRNGGGSGKSPSSFEQLLRRRIDSLKRQHQHATVDDLVSQLRSTFHDYSRQKNQPFTRAVERTLELMKRTNISKKSKFSMDEDEDDDGVEGKSPVRKRRKVSSSEERIRRLEEEHVRRKRLLSDDVESTSSSSEDDEDQEESSADGTDDDAGVSTSEDGIYEEKVEPKFDLMRSMLRESYSKDGAKLRKQKGADKEEKDMEVEEVVSNKTSKKIDLSGGNGNNSERRNGLGSGSDVSQETKGKKEGPSFKDLGGMSKKLDELITAVVIPLLHPQLPSALGVRPLSGILLHGPPGCGKTKLAHAIASETGIPFYKTSATALVSGVSGASEENIREIFAKAHRSAPSIVFIDEIDAIASKRENLQREMEKRIVTQLMTCMDESYSVEQTGDGDPNAGSSDRRSGHVLVIGATNRPDAVDSALRRPGRFDWEITLGVPDENARIDILRVLSRNLRVEGDFDLLKVARSTPGFVGADLAALVNKAGNLAMKRIIEKRKTELSGESTDGNYPDDWWRHPWLPEETENLSITMAHFEEAASLVQPSSRREGFSSIPNVKWEDVGGLDSIREQFNRYIIKPIKHPEAYERMGISIDTGFLLYGPPGCGKTLIAKAVANEAGANFIHIKGPELLNKYVGESELAVRTIFSRARTCSPCILFFDEVDALTKKRGSEGGWVVERLLNQLLIELDGADQRKGVFVIGATNEPEVMDEAVIRPGRFGKRLYVNLPTADERGLILKALARKKPIDASVDLIAIGKDKACENLSGADLSALIHEAAMFALEDNLIAESNNADMTSLAIKEEHLRKALNKARPSVAEERRHHYQSLSERFGAD